MSVRIWYLSFSFWLTSLCIIGIGSSTSSELTQMCSFLWLSNIPLVYSIGRRQGHPTPVLLPGKSHRWRSLVGCNPWGRTESYMTERLHFHFSLSCIGEGNGNPLQCSCLENPRDKGAWWAAVYGVAQSRIRLKRLSSSNIPSCVCTTTSLSIHLSVDI